MTAYGCVGWLYLEQGDLEAAMAVFERGLALCRASGHWSWLRSIADGLGIAYARVGRLAEAFALIENGGTESVGSGGPFNRASQLRRLSEVEFLAGHLAAARKHADHALTLARQQKRRGTEARVLYLLGTIGTHTDPPHAKRAEARYEEARTQAEELGMRPLQAHCHRGLGTLYAETGRPEEARVALSTAIDLYRSMDMNYWLPQAEASLRQCSGQALPG